jgi:hypothetical protein
MAEFAAPPIPDAPSRAAQVALWLPGLFVAAGAIAATAHGLYEVAIAAQVPPAIAWLYPVITDGLASWHMQQRRACTAQGAATPGRSSRLRPGCQGWHRPR